MNWPGRAHQWVRPTGFKWDFCAVCGFVRRADDKNKPCRGPSRVGPRGESETRS